jgi:tRNA(His) guanylyltransferase
MIDALGQRMKERYEDRIRILLPRRSYTVIRIDGKAFHSYTRNLKRPFDDSISYAMDRTAIELCSSIQGVQIAYVQSDEISIITTDFDNIHTEAWFNGNLQKIVSISSSMATAAFNEEIIAQCSSTHSFKSATFDARAFVIPDREEVLNYLIWRQQDATRNSIQMVAQSLYSHKELHGKNSSQLQEMIFRKGQNWDDYSIRNKRGHAIIRVATPEDRHKWIADTNTPIFTQDRDYLYNKIPVHGYEQSK